MLINVSRRKCPVSIKKGKQVGPSPQGKLPVVVGERICFLADNVAREVSCLKKLIFQNSPKNIIGVLEKSIVLLS